MATKDIKIGGMNTVKRSWKNFNPDRCTQKFKDEDWSSILREENLDVASSILEEKIGRIIDSEAPFKTLQVRKGYHNWITDNTKNEMKLRDKARDKAKNTDLDSDWQQYRLKRNMCTSLQKKDKASYYKSLFQKMEDTNDSKKIFSTTKQLLGQTPTSPPTGFLVNGIFIRKQKDIADILAKFYMDKVDMIKDSLPGVNLDPLRILRRALRRWNPPAGNPKFTLKETTTSEVLKLIKALKNSHAYGRDQN